MALSKSPYRGTRDFFPSDMRLRNFMFQKMSEVSERFAYEPYDGPLLEDIELYLAKSGEELINEQIYSFKDRGDRTVVIRPEMTPTLARMIAQIHREVPKPIRMYAIPNLMRYEKPQKGRLREFYQYNADIFGAGLHGQVEILQLAVDIMKSLGATSEHFEILVNDRTFVDFVFTKMLNLGTEKNAKLYKLVDKKNKMDPVKFSTEVRAIIEEEGKAKIFEEYTSIASFSDVIKFAKAHGFEGEELPLDALRIQLERLNLLEYVKYDPSIVRGLDYYTGVVFEIFDKHPENRRAIAGGGAYANLLQIFNEPALEGVGIGMGEVPLNEFLAAHGLKPDVSKPTFDFLVAYQVPEAESAAMNLAQDLRNKNKKVELYFGEAKPKKIFGYSEKKNFGHVCFIGEEEMKNCEMKVKDLAARTEQTIKIKEFIEGIR
ncbi:MAG TPA: histidine--tRNA ligase [Bacteriovoracaceae bacterium]|nr:histidine--tRNA ligase [Bacteriovoracaceae bacterium]